VLPRTTPGFEAVLGSVMLYSLHRN
jgi:hypothetical protein